MYFPDDWRPSWCVSKVWSEDCSQFDVPFPVQTGWPDGLAKRGAWASRTSWKRGEWSQYIVWNNPAEEYESEFTTAGCRSWTRYWLATALMMNSCPEPSQRTSAYGRSRENTRKRPGVLCNAVRIHHSSSFSTSNRHTLYPALIWPKTITLEEKQRSGIQCYTTWQI